jgi:hypothetical protein
MSHTDGEPITPRVAHRLVHSQRTASPLVTRPRSGLRRRLVTAIVVLLVFLSPWDNLLTTLQAGRLSSISVGMFLSFILVVLSLPEIFASLARSILARVVLLFPMVLVPGAFLSLSRGSVEASTVIRFLILWLGYCLVALAIAGWQLRTDGFVRPLFKALVVSSLLLTTLSFLDYYTAIQIPYINEIGRSTALRTDAGVRDAMLGTFESRTQAAVVFEGIAAFLLGYGIIVGSRWHRFLSFITLTIIIVFMLHTGNRSFLLAIAATIVALLYFGRGLTRFRWFVYVATALLAIVFAGNFLFPDQAAFYQARLQTMFVERDISESDLLRVVLLETAIESIQGGRIFGNGPQGIPVPVTSASDISERDPHSIPTFVIWTAGILGGIWLVAFVLLVVRTMLGKPYEVVRPMLPYFLPILASFVGGVAHASLGNLNLWIFLGLLIGSYLRTQNSVFPPGPPSSLRRRARTSRRQLSGGAK